MSEDTPLVGAGPTILEQFREELSREIARPEIDIPIIMRPGLVARFSPNITAADYSRWGRSVAGKGNRKKQSEATDLEQLTLAAQVIANTCVGLFWEDQLIVDEQGAPVIFGHPLLFEDVPQGVPEQRVLKSVQNLFVNDINIVSIYFEIMGAAGYDDELEVSEAGQAPLDQ